LKVVLPPG